jgi:hypothetical protein
MLHCVTEESLMVAGQGATWAETGVAAMAENASATAAVMALRVAEGLPLARAVSDAATKQLRAWLQTTRWIWFMVSSSARSYFDYPQYIKCKVLLMIYCLVDASQELVNFCKTLLL